MDVELNTAESTSAPPTGEEEMKKDVFKYFGFQPNRDSPSDARNTLLVVAALIAAVTFDKGIDVPDIIKDVTHARVMFVIANTLAFSASMTVIEFLTSGFPFKREIRVSVFTVCFAYGVGAASYIKGIAEFVALLVAIFTPFLLRLPNLPK